MIKEVYLFTNRNVLVFDEKGEQIIDIQKAIGWGVEWFEHKKEEEALRKIIADKPEIYIASWNDRWQHKITVDEFCSLLGHGPWYWENYKKPVLKEGKENVQED